MQIKLTSVSDAEAISRYYLENYHALKHLKPWEPEREVTSDSINAWRKRLAERDNEMLAGQARYFIALDSTGQHVMASCSLTQIARGGFQAAYMGYSVAQKYEGQGVMRQLCEHVVRYAFEELTLNRIMANHLPSNDRSAKLLARLGFVREGFASKYLRINGRWEDHVLNALINPSNV